MHGAFLLSLLKADSRSENGFILKSTVVVGGAMGLLIALSMLIFLSAFDNHQENTNGFSLARKTGLELIKHHIENSS